MVRWSVKVSKFQKQILLLTFEPKNEQNLISALVSKRGGTKKIMVPYYIISGVLNITEVFIFFSFDPF